MFTEIVSGVGMFILVVLSLVVLILVTRSKLVASGDVNILINGDESKAIAVPAGDKLLNVLADNKIFVSSACGFMTVSVLGTSCVMPMRIAVF